MQLLYALNVVSGFMGSIQQPASEVATSLLVSRQHHQWAAGLRSLSYAATTLMVPLAATALLSIFGLPSVCIVDTASFTIAFISLMLCIHIPALSCEGKSQEHHSNSIRSSWIWLREHPQLLSLLIFMGWINLFASMDDAALTPMILSRTGSRSTLAIVNTAAGLAMVAGGLIMTALPRPKNRIRVIVMSMTLSFAIGNVMLALPASLYVWCLGIMCCWIAVPVQMTNQDSVMRDTIPLAMQSGVYAVRNAIQSAAIPSGYLLAGWLIDSVLEPAMQQSRGTFIATLLGGSHKGSGAGLMLLIDGIAAVTVCIFAMHNKHLGFVTPTNKSSMR